MRRPHRILLRRASWIRSHSSRRKYGHTYASKLLRSMAFSHSVRFSGVGPVSSTPALRTFSPFVRRLFVGAGVQLGYAALAAYLPDRAALRFGLGFCALVGVVLAAADAVPPVDRRQVFFCLVPIALV